MLKVSNLVGFNVSSAGGPVLTYLDAAETTSDLTTYTFSSVNFGAASSDRIIAVIFFTERGSRTRNVSSATIGGITATVAGGNSQDNQVVDIVYANVTSGTSGTVAVTLNDACWLAAIEVYSITGLTTLTHTAVDTVNGTSVGSATLTVNYLKDGVILAAACCRNESTTVSYTGATEQGEHGITSEDIGLSWATYEGGAADPTYDVGLTFSSSDWASGICVSFGDT